MATFYTLMSLLVSFLRIKLIGVLLHIKILVIRLFNFLFLIIYYFFIIRFKILKNGTDKLVNRLLR